MSAAPTTGLTLSSVHCSACQYLKHHTNSIAAKSPPLTPDPDKEADTVLHLALEAVDINLANPLDPVSFHQAISTPDSDQWHAKKKKKMWLTRFNLADLVMYTNSYPAPLSC